ncbi:sporulation protein [Streptomyces sp. NPDC047072]|uniref:sporulation protein n=1 Tax=Streptomyces sp. NPDC047072 TaxID=3154809 RepID=UPI003404A2E7
MGFKRLFGGGDEAVEVDTRILGPALPGGRLRGEVLLRGGRRDLYVDYLDLQVRVRCADFDGHESSYEVDTHSAEPAGFTLRKGEERRLTFSQRLPWETPLTELGGRALGTALSVRSRITRGDDDGVDVDDDLLHVSALPLHEAVLDVFAEEGYLCESARVDEGDVPDTEQRLGIVQTLLLTGHVPGRPDALEVTFQTNAVGATVHVRRAAPDERHWEDKPPARRFPLAHHEVDTVEWRDRVLDALGELPLPDNR